MNIFKNVYNLFKNVFLNKLEKREREILTKISHCKELNINPYETTINITVCTDDIVTCLNVIKQYNSMDIKKDIFKPPQLSNHEVKLYVWFSDNNTLLDNPTIVWLHLLEEYQRLVRLYFKHYDDVIALASTNAIRIRSYIFKIEEFIDTILNMAIYNR